MALRKLKPTTPGQRGASVPDFAEITRSTPEKSLIRPIHSKGGRNNAGRVTVRHQGGGHKRAYRLIDFVRNDKDGIQQRLHTLNTIQTAQRVSHSFITQMEKSATSSLQINLSKVQQLKTVQRPISSLETTCHFATSQ